MIRTQNGTMPSVIDQKTRSTSLSTAIKSDKADISGILDGVFS